MMIAINTDFPKPFNTTALNAPYPLLSAVVCSAILTWLN